MTDTNKSKEEGPDGHLTVPYLYAKHTEDEGNDYEVILTFKDTQRLKEVMLTEYYSIPPIRHMVIYRH